MILHATVVSEVDAVKDLDERSDVDVESGFFAHFAGDGVVQRLAYFNRAAGQTPFPFERLVRTFDEHDTFAVDNNGANTHDRPLGKLPNHNILSYHVRRPTQKPQKFYLLCEFTEFGVECRGVY